MYPLHKYLPTSFGSYLMYIDHGPERVRVNTIPKDLKVLKEELAKKPKHVRPHPARDTSVPLAGAGKHEKKDKKTKKVPPEVQTSYQIRFLEHNGQKLTEQPSNIVIVDDITGADVTSSMTWIRNRPRKWNEIIKLHQVENPEATSTLPKPAPLPPSNKSTYPAGEKLMSVRTSSIPPRRQPATAPPRDHDPSLKLHGAMLPHLAKQEPRYRGRERREAREEAAQKRRRRAKKIMNIVSNRAQIAAIKAQKATDETVCTRAGTYWNMGGDYSPTNETPYRRTLQPIEEETVDRYVPPRENTQGRASVRKEESPPKIQDWNPREDQKMLNHLLLERMGATVPYQWKTKLENSQVMDMKTAPRFKYVL